MLNPGFTDIIYLDSMSDVKLISRSISDSVKLGAAVPFRFIFSNISAFIFNSSSRKMVTYFEQQDFNVSKIIASCVINNESFVNGGKK